MEAGEVRFEIRFDPDAVREYEMLVNSVLKIVNKKFEVNALTGFNRLALNRKKKQ